MVPGIADQKIIPNANTIQVFAYESSLAEFKHFVEENFTNNTKT